MKSQNKIIIASLGAVAFLTIAAGGALVYAQSTSANGSAFLDRVAQLAGVDSKKLADSIKQATKEQIDQDVKDGRLSQSQADKMKSGVENGNAPLLKGYEGMHRKEWGKSMIQPNLDDLAAFLGTDKAAMIQEYQGGKTLLEIAKSKGKSESDLKSFLSQKFDENLDKALKDGVLSQSKADELKKNKDLIVDKVLNSRGPWMKGHGKMMDMHNAL